MVKSTIRQQHRLTKIDWFSSSNCYIFDDSSLNQMSEEFSMLHSLFSRWTTRYRPLSSTSLNRNVRTGMSTGSIAGFICLFFLFSRSGTSSFLSVNYRMMMLANKPSVIQGWCHSDMCQVSVYFLDDTDLSLTLDPCWHRINNNYNQQIETQKLLFILLESIFVARLPMSNLLNVRQCQCILQGTRWSSATLHHRSMKKMPTVAASQRH